MEINIRKTEGEFGMQATNEKGGTINMNSGTEEFSPMQLVASAAGGCSTIDIIMILKKQRQELKDIRVKVTGERQEGEVPAVFHKIRLHYILFGNLDNEKVKRAIDLSLEKYCSVSKMLESTVEIISSYEIRPAE